MRRLAHLLSWALAFATSAVAITPTWSATLAGQPIEAVAHVCYIDTVTGQRSHLKSNTVAVTVQAVEALMVSPGLVLRRSPGGKVVVAHQLSNSGNTPVSARLEWAAHDAGLPALQGPTVHHDLNGNGVVDPGEPELQNQNTVGTLAVGGSIRMVASGTVPSSAKAGDAYGWRLRFVTPAGTSQAVSDRVDVSDGAVMQVQASTTQLSPRAGDRIGLTLLATNIGNVAAGGTPVQVNGVGTERALLKLNLPPNTTLVGADPVAGEPAAFHVRGTPDHVWQTDWPADRAAIDAIGFAPGQPLASGQSIRRTVWLDVNANVSGALKAQASVLFRDGVNALPVETASNMVEMQSEGRAPRIQVYRNSAMTEPASITSAGKPLYVALDAAQCNRDGQSAETHQVQISAEISADVERFDAQETLPNSGVFEVRPAVPTRDSQQGGPVLGDGVLTVARNDRLIISMAGCGTDLVQSDVLVDPFGVVFDSRSNAPVAGAKVRLIDVLGQGNGGQPGALAEVYAADAVTRSPSEVTTGADGAYQFPLVRPSTYRLEVTAPAGFAFPSALAPDLLPDERVVLNPVSYGGLLVITRETPPVQADLPVDADAQAGFFIEKTALRNAVEVGEFVDYQVRIKNLSGAWLGQIALDDRLPIGFHLVEGTWRVDGKRVNAQGQALAEPQGAAATWRFPVGSLAPNAQITVSYKTRVSPEALLGDGVNRAHAHTPGPLAKLSNESSARVKVLPGVFTDKAHLLGEVVALCSDGEGLAMPLGVPGVRLYMDQGSHVTSDSQGRFSMAGLSPRTHVLRVDTTSLPEGLRVLGNSIRQAGEAHSQFLDLARGELHRSRVVIGPCDTPQQRQAIERRIKDWQQTHELQWAAGTLQQEERIATTMDPRSLPAEGLRRRGGAPGASTVERQPTESRGTTTDRAKPRSASRETRQEPAAETDASTVKPEEWGTLQATLGFERWPANSQTPTRQVRLWVRSTGTDAPRLRVNGHEVSDRHVGQHLHWPEQGVHLREYVGIDLRTGENEIALEQGTQRLQQRLIAAGDASRLAWRIEGAGPWVAGPGKVARLRLQSLDDQGRPTHTSLQVTLSGSAGQWLAQDINPGEPGLQVVLEQGEVQVELAAPEQAGEVQLQASSGTMNAKVSLRFEADLRPLLVVGLVEGQWSSRGSDRKLQPASSADGFDETLAQGPGVRSALYLKGKVRGDALLTVAYDSGKARDTLLFRDVQPDQFYPVYGDASVQGFDAQSTGKLYVRVDKGRSHALLGDFQTQVQSDTRLNTSRGEAALDERRLSRVQRSLNGAQVHAESQDGRWRVVGHHAETLSHQVIDELPATGLSGPYALSRAPFVANSEQVELIVRNKEQRNQILSRQALSRFVDYEIDVISGRILLRAPALSTDAELNPRFLRVTYESERSSSRSAVMGADMRGQLTDTLSIGAAVHRDERPLAQTSVEGFTVAGRLGEHTAMVVELAQGRSEKDRLSGQAGRVEMLHDRGPLRLQWTTQHTESGFHNPSAGVTPGASETQVRAEWRAGEKTLLKGELQQQRQLLTGQDRALARAGLSTHLADGWRLDSSLQDRRTDDKGSQTTVSQRLVTQWPGAAQSMLYLEHEVNVRQPDQNMVAIGGEAQSRHGTRFYARQSLQSTLPIYQDPGLPARQQGTQLGMSHPMGNGGQAFTEYRQQDQSGARSAEAAMGARQRWVLNPVWTLFGGLENVQPLEGVSLNAGHVVHAGAEVQPRQDMRLSGRSEWRRARDSAQWLHLMGIAWQLDAQWTGLAKAQWRAQQQRAATDTGEQLMQLGLAYRGDARQPWSGLTRLQWRQEDLAGTEASATLAREVWTWSSHVNHHLNNDTQISVRLAMKWAHEQGVDWQAWQDAQLLSGKFSWLLNPKLTAVLHAHALLGNSGQSARLGLGTEIGRVVWQGLWASVGFNFFSFRDVDLLQQRTEQPGLFIRLRWKFDENSF